MLRFVKHTIWLLGVMIGCQSAFGFALIGPPLTNGLPDTFQTGTIGYDPGGSDGANPRDIREEYRRNTPVVYYAYDQAFWEYFSTNGVQELDKAFAIYNSIGKVTELNPADYPEDSRRVNFRAQANGLVDLKSFIMGLMTQEVGLFEPTRWVWALHDRQVLPGPPPCPFNMAYQIYHRNFSITPVGDDTYPTTTYVNGVLYSYFIDEFCTGPDPLADAVEFPVDPLSSPYSAVADFTSLWYAGLPVGGFYTSLTRDDVAGLKYIYATNNVNNEASGARVAEFITNSTPAAIQTFDLGVFAAQARVSTAAALAALYPGLIITSTTNTFGLQITTNITQFLVNAPTDPAGVAPSHALFSTNYTTNFVQFFDHTFANLVTNSFSTRGIVGTLTLGLSVPPFSPAGTIPALTTNNSLILRPLPVTGVFGDFFILPTNVCGAQILSNLLTTVVATTNLPTIIVGPTTNSITFTPGSITFATNHIVVYLPVTCPLDSIAPRGGVDRIIFIRRDYDQLSGQVWDPVTNDYTLPERDESTKTVSLRHFQRRVPRPDFLFSAGDLTTENNNMVYSNSVDGVPQTFTFGIALFGQALELNSGLIFDSRGRPTSLAGPGTIVDPTVLPRIYVLNKLEPLFENFSLTGGTTNSFLFPNELTQVTIPAWGSFDGTTNAPVVYPNGTSLQEFENLLLGPAATTRFLPNANVGLHYSAQLSAIGGQAPYTWSLAPGSPSLPDGLNLSADGQITGIPNGPPAIYDFVVRLTDSAGAFRDIQFTITVF